MDELQEYNTHQLLLSQLRQDETLLWAGKSSTKQMLISTDAFLIPLSAIMLFSVSKMLFPMVTGRIALEIPGIVILPLLFVFLLYLCFGRFFYKYHCKKHTRYAITNNRLILITTRRDNNLKRVFTLEITEVKEAIITLGSKKRASILFSRYGLGIRTVGVYNTGMEGYGRSWYHGVIPFYDLDDYDVAFGIYKEAKQKAGSE